MASHGRTRLLRSVWLWGALVFLLSFAYRVLSPKLTNDDFIFLAGARQILQYGEWPIRDFMSEGRPLHYVLSAAAQSVAGYRLLAEVLLDVLFLSTGAVLTLVFVRLITGSLTSGVIAAVFVVILGPRLYNYPKIVLPPLWLLLLWVYAGRRSIRALAALAAFVAVAGLYRHDYGMYLVLGTSIALIAVHWPSGRSQIARRIALFSAFTAAALAPFAMYVQAHGGVPAYVRQIASFADREFERTELERPKFAIDRSRSFLAIDPATPAPRPIVSIRWTRDVDANTRTTVERRYGLIHGRSDDERTWRYELTDAAPSMLTSLIRDERVEDTHNLDRNRGVVLEWPHDPLSVRLQRRVPLLRLGFARNVRLEANAVAWLYYVTVAAPLLLLLSLLRGWIRHGPTAIEATLLGAVVLASAAAAVLLRGELNVNGRLTELAPLTAVVGGGLLWSWRAVWPVRQLIVIAVAMSFWSAGMIGAPARQIENIGMLDGVGSMRRQFTQVSEAVMVSPPVKAWAPPRQQGLRKLVNYIRECTGTEDKILVTWFGPEVYFYAGRGFAGGRTFFLPGYWASPSEQRAVIDRLERESVPIVLADIGPYDGGMRYTQFERGFPLVDAYLRERHQVVDESLMDETGSRYRVLIDRRHPPTGVHQPTGLPCFRLR